MFKKKVSKSSKQYLKLSISSYSLSFYKSFQDFIYDKQSYKNFSFHQYTKVFSPQFKVIRLTIFLSRNLQT